VPSLYLLQVSLMGRFLYGYSPFWAAPARRHIRTPIATIHRLTTWAGTITSRSEPETTPRNCSTPPRNEAMPPATPTHPSHGG
jgi:hypothetical protein